MEGGIEVAHGLDEGVDCAAIFEVADECDVEVVECALSFTDGVEVEHALGRMLVGAVAGIDDGYGGHLGGIARGALFGISHDDEVGIAGNHDDGVVERFAFLYTCSAWVAESNDTCTELVGGAFKTQSCTGGRLEEEGGDDFVAKNALLGVLLKSFGNIQHLDVFFFSKVGDGNKIASFKCAHDIFILICELFCN